MPVVLMLLILLLSVAGATAQGGDVYCGTLEEADCALLQANREADASLTSMRFELDMDMSISQGDLPPMAFAVNSAGVMAYDKADLDAMNEEILDTTVREILALLEDPDALIDRLTGYGKRLAEAPALDMNLSLVLPEGAAPGMDAVTLDLRMVDGALYATSPLLAMAELPPDAWISVDFPELLDMLADTLKNPAFMEGMMGSMMGGGSPGLPMPPTSGMDDDDDGDDDGADAEMFNRFMAIINAPYWEEIASPEFMAQIETITRLPDAEIDGVAVAVFEDRVDMAAMVESEAFQQMMTDMLSVFGSAMSPAQADVILPPLLDIIGQMEIVSTMAIGLEDHYTYSSTMEWSLTVDVQAMAESMAEADPDMDLPETPIPPQTQTFHLRQELRDHNQPVTVEPPPAESVIPLMALLMGGPPPA